MTHDLLATVLRPRRIRLEASSVCQLRCPSCPTTTKATLPVIGAGSMSFQDFQALIDRHPWIEEIELSNYGEPFLNPSLARMLEFAFEHGVALTCNNGANFNHVDEAVLEAAVRFQLRSLTCSIDGATQATYGAYRVRGNFDRVVSNIRRLN